MNQYSLSVLSTCYSNDSQSDYMYCISSKFDFVHLGRKVIRICQVVKQRLGNLDYVHLPHTTFKTPQWPKAAAGRMGACRQRLARPWSTRPYSVAEGCSIGGNAARTTSRAKIVQTGPAASARLPILIIGAALDTQMCRAASNVTSNYYRSTNHSAICCSSTLVSVLSSPSGSNYPQGSAISAERMRTGTSPLQYQCAVPRAKHTVLLSPPYQASACFVQPVPGSAKRAANVA